MQIDYVIVSCDDNQMYSEFWEVIKPVWINKINIKPIIVKISEKNQIIDHGEFIVHEIKKINNINSGFQSQIARMFVTKFYSDKVCLTSDIDMIPLNENYFKETVKPYNENDLIIYSADAYGSDKRFPICYNAAKGSTFSSLLDLENYTFEEYTKKLIDRHEGWDTDEFYFGECVFNKSKEINVIKLNRGWGMIADRRIDRVMWSYEIEDVKKGYYIDAHSLRPYSQYKNKIDQLIELL
jgi:hypothetical protein